MSNQQQSMQIPNELTQQQALEVLVSGVQVAQSKGVYNLQEAELISKACRVFIKPQHQTPPPQPPSDDLQTPTPSTPQHLPPVNDPQNIQTI